MHIMQPSQQIHTTTLPHISCLLASLWHPTYLSGRSSKHSIPCDLQLRVLTHCRPGSYDWVHHFFCKPISQLFNLSLATSTVPTQWKQASIRPVPKVASPTLLTDFRPISVTPVLTRTMERFVVSFYIRALSPLHLPFLGRLPKVDLIILEGGKMSVRTSVRPQKVSSISMKFGI